MKPSDVLSLAADVIDNGYCKDRYAKNKASEGVGVMDPTAEKFCLLGSVARVLGGSILAADRIVDKWVQIPTALVEVSFLGKPLQEMRPTARSWNDKPYVSGSAVAAALREGSKNAAAKGE